MSSELQLLRPTHDKIKPDIFITTTIRVSDRSFSPTRIKQAEKAADASASTFFPRLQTSPRTPKALTPKVGWLEFQCKAGLSAVGPLFHGKMPWRNELYSEWWRERWPLLIPTLLAASRLFQQPHCSEVKSEGEKPQRSPSFPSCCRTTPSIQRFEKLPGLSSRGRTSLHSAGYELE